ncbi:MAG: AAA family ATPase [Candidatus Woesearchaeota archaeon]|jgi:adenylate kinase|nr:AAA family ATPase [Candidatus Woesearchaeota archaeon]HJO01418.1 AAA family ATPase [Candidatus Woesearchaeota archaeon]|tara:strand:- start:1279 stop:1764 length:486 start_codon:yes stop_codon:yes gene_type:complete
MKTIIVGGTPGTGKTTLAKRLAKKLNFHYLDVNKIIEKYNISEGYDKKRDTKIIDTKKLNLALTKEIRNFKQSKEGIIIDSHLSHYLPKKYVDLCIVTKCNLKELENRLKKKKYSKSKIRENLDAEIFDVCLNEAKENRHKVIVIDTTKGLNIENISRKIK